MHDFIGEVAVSSTLTKIKILVVDDVWRKQDLDPFLQGGRHCVRLVTTRIDGVLPATAAREKVDAMQGAEALSLLSGGLPADQAIRERAGLRDLAARLGEWPLLIKIVNGFLRNRVKDGEPLPVAITGANTRLNKKGLTAFDKSDETERADAVALTIGVSLDLLSKPERERFGELGVFPEDADVPIGVVARLWSGTGGLEDFETEDLLTRLFDLSLLLHLDLGQRYLRLHDTVRHFLRDRAGKDGLVARHKQLVAALDGVAVEQIDGRTRRYFYSYLPHHLAEAGEREKLGTLLLDPAWLKAKLDVTGAPHALVSDYQLYGEGEAQSLIARTLQLISGILARDGRQLLPQLIGRLTDFEAMSAVDLLANARPLFRGPAIVPMRPSLTAPGAETGRLVGHLGSVDALCLLSDARLASASHDNTISLWDVATGVETTLLKGHDGSVAALCLLSDGRLTSGSADNTIRLWDLATEAETARLEGHDQGVNALCLLPDGRLVSGSEDKTIRLWDITTGLQTACFEGHTGWVTALCLLPDGRLASSSWDKTIRLWDVVAGAETARFEGHDLFVGAQCQLADGRLASGSDDKTIRFWDIATGAEKARYTGHADGVKTLCQLADGRLASGSFDMTIRLWDVATESQTAHQKRHEGAVNALCLLKDGQLASGSDDQTIRLWDVATGAETAQLTGHAGGVKALCQLADGRLAVGSDDDQAIRLWEVGAIAEATRLERYDGSVSALCLLTDGRLASGYTEGAIWLWDAATDAEPARLQGHVGIVTCLCVLNDERLASCSDDATIRIWEGGKATKRRRGHTSVAYALCALNDGRLASGSDDEMIRLWDVSAVGESAHLDGHSHAVSAFCLLPDGRLVSGSSDSTIRLWDVGRCVEVARLELDAPITALITIAPNRIVAGDQRGLLHWLEIVD
ncbi:MAG TPA: hypothetical protein VGG77_06050 [Roseiarcus sp.]